MRGDPLRPEKTPHTRTAKDISSKRVSSKRVSNTSRGRENVGCCTRTITTMGPPCLWAFIRVHHHQISTLKATQKKTLLWHTLDFFFWGGEWVGGWGGGAKPQTLLLFKFRPQVQRRLCQNIYFIFFLFLIYGRKRKSPAKASGLGGAWEDSDPNPPHDRRRLLWGRVSFFFLNFTAHLKTKPASFF